MSTSTKSKKSGAGKTRSRIPSTRTQEKGAQGRFVRVSRAGGKSSVKTALNLGTAEKYYGARDPAKAGGRDRSQFIYVPTYGIAGHRNEVIEFLEDRGFTSIDAAGKTTAIPISRQQAEAIVNDPSVITSQNFRNMPAFVSAVANKKAAGPKVRAVAPAATWYALGFQTRKSAAEEAASKDRKKKKSEGKKEKKEGSQTRTKKGTKKGKGKGKGKGGKKAANKPVNLGEKLKALTGDKALDVTNLKADNTTVRAIQRTKVPKGRRLFFSNAGQAFVAETQDQAVHAAQRFGLPELSQAFLQAPAPAVAPAAPPAPSNLPPVMPPSITGLPSVSQLPPVMPPTLPGVGLPTVSSLPQPAMTSTRVSPTRSATRSPVRRSGSPVSSPTLPGQVAALPTAVPAGQDWDTL
jgi:hypothetical protein